METGHLRQCWRTILLKAVSKTSDIVGRKFPLIAMSCKPFIEPVLWDCSGVNVPLLQTFHSMYLGQM